MSGGSRSWRIAVPVMAAVLVLVGGLLVFHDDSEPPAPRVEVGLGHVRRYAGPQLSLAPTTATTPAALPDAEPAATREAAATEEIDCNFSIDPACGDWYWDPVLINQPATIDDVRMEPANPVAGDTVTVTITASDPDADVVFIDFRCGDPGCPAPAAATPARVCDYLPTGRWEPPDPRPVTRTQTFTYVYQDPGAFEWAVYVSTALSTYPGFVEAHRGVCVPFDPYASGAFSTGTIVVASPEPPASTSTAVPAETAATTTTGG